MHKKSLLFLFCMVLSSTIWAKSIDYDSLPIETGISSAGALAELGQLWREWRASSAVAGLKKEIQPLLEERDELDEVLKEETLSPFYKARLSAQRDALQERVAPIEAEINEKESVARKKANWWGKISQTLYALDTGINPYNKTERTIYVAPASGVAGHLLTAKAQEGAQVGKNLLPRLLLLIARVVLHAFRNFGDHNHSGLGDKTKRLLPLIDLARAWLSTSGSDARKTRAAAVLAHLLQAGLSIAEGPIDSRHVGDAFFTYHLPGVVRQQKIPVVSSLGDLLHRAQGVAGYLHTGRRAILQELQQRWGHPTAYRTRNNARESFRVAEQPLMSQLAQLQAPQPSAIISPQAYHEQTQHFAKVLEAAHAFVASGEAPEAVRTNITTLLNGRTSHDVAEQAREQRLPAVLERHFAGDGQVRAQVPGCVSNPAAHSLLQSSDEVNFYLRTGRQQVLEDLYNEWRGFEKYGVGSVIRESLARVEQPLMNQLAHLRAPDVAGNDTLKSYEKRIAHFDELLHGLLPFIDSDQLPCRVGNHIRRLLDGSTVDEFIEELRNRYLPIIADHEVVALAAECSRVTKAVPTPDDFFASMEEKNPSCPYEWDSSDGLRHGFGAMGNVSERLQQLRSAIEDTGFVRGDPLAYARERLDSLGKSLETHMTAYRNNQAVAGLSFNLIQMANLKQALVEQMREVNAWQPKASATRTVYVRPKVSVSSFEPSGGAHTSYHNIQSALTRLIDHVRGRIDELGGQGILPAYVDRVASDMREKIKPEETLAWVAEQVAWADETISSKKAKAKRAKEAEEEARRAEEAQRAEEARKRREEDEARRWRNPFGSSFPFGRDFPFGSGFPYGSGFSGGFGGFPGGSHRPRPPRPAPPAENVIHLLQRAIDADQGADYAATKKAYHKFALKEHPDKLDQRRGEFASDASFLAAKGKSKKYFQAVTDVWGTVREDVTAFERAQERGIIADLSKDTQAVLREMGAAKK